MLSVSKNMTKKLSDITEKEEKLIEELIKNKFVPECNIPSVAGSTSLHSYVAVAAPVSAGKSTLFNALCGYPILPVASKITSCAPTYITRAKSRNEERVSVYEIKKVEESQKSGLTSMYFVRDEEHKRVFSANDISEKLFKELFDYMYFLVHGSGIKYAITIENLGYFMSTPDKANILFNGSDQEKFSLKKEDFALRYDDKRHRFLLLLILLCVYVNQNLSEDKMTPYIKKVNEKRKALLNKLGLPTNSDYCVYLDWYSDDIPEDVTLIDLPGTGADIADNGSQSSHTALVRGILTEADSVWVLCSDNGTVDRDLLIALGDTLGGNSRKSKVCIYNCKNNRPFDSQPVTEFLDKLPSLTGERCYVVDALAGEYKFIQNGINVLNTQSAALMQQLGFPHNEKTMEDTLKLRYSDASKHAYYTFTTTKDDGGKIVATQDQENKYTLDSFFKKALTDYIERLKYELALKEAIKQSEFFLYIKDSLFFSHNLLLAVNGKGKKLAEAVKEALEKAYNKAIDDFVVIGAEHQSNISYKLKTLAESLSKNIEKEFTDELAALINNVKNTWLSLENKDDTNCLVADGLTGSYSLRESRDVGAENLAKFNNVGNKVKDNIAIDAFGQAMDVSECSIKSYKSDLQRYVDNLKSAICEFTNNYINAFETAFNEKRDNILETKDNALSKQLERDFNSTRERLKEDIQVRLDSMTKQVCSEFDILLEPNGIFEKLCEETEKDFRTSFCVNILDGFRNDMDSIYKSIHHQGWFFNRLSPTDLHEIINDDYDAQTKNYSDKLKNLINEIYGMQGGTDKSFPTRLNKAVNDFHARQILSSAKQTIKNTNDTNSALVDFAAKNINVDEKIEEIKGAIHKWRDIGTKEYAELGKIMEDSPMQNTHNLYEDCKKLMAEINSKAEI